MSNDRKPTNGPPQHQDEIPIAHLRPTAVGAGMLHPGDPTKVLTSRVKGAEGYANGYEITWVRPRRSFRVDHFNHNELVGTRWVPESQVHEYAEVAPAS